MTYYWGSVSCRWVAYGPVILVVITYGKRPLINAHAYISRETRGLNFGMILHILQGYLYTSSEDSGESVHPPEPSLLVDAISTNFFALANIIFGMDPIVDIIFGMDLVRGDIYRVCICVIKGQHCI